MKIEKYIPNSSILEKTLSYAFKNCIPLVTTLEVTQNCNFSCTHCYNFDRTTLKNHPENDQALTPNRILELIDELSEMGTFFLNLSGGEALANKNIFNYIKRASDNNLEVRLKTNAALIDAMTAKKLKESGLKGVDISLYGASEISYNQLTQTDGSYNKVLEAIENLIKENIDIHISIILHRENFNELDLMIDFCKDRNLLYQISTEITDRYDSSKTSRELELTTTQYEQLLTGPYSSQFASCNPKGCYQCSCARSVCGISFKGDVYPCIGAPIYSGNINDARFESIWKTSKELNKIRDLKSTDFKECVKCDYQDYCNRSSGSVYINTGNYTGCEKSVLEQAKLRASLQKINV